MLLSLITLNNMRGSIDFIYSPWSSCWGLVGWIILLCLAVVFLWINRVLKYFGTYAVPYLLSVVSSNHEWPLCTLVCSIVMYVDKVHIHIAMMVWYYLGGIYPNCYCRIRWPWRNVSRQHFKLKLQLLLTEVFFCQHSLFIRTFIFVHKCQ